MNTILFLAASKQNFARVITVILYRLEEFFSPCKGVWLSKYIENSFIFYMECAWILQKGLINGRSSFCSTLVLLHKKRPDHIFDFLSIQSRNASVNQRGRSLHFTVWVLGQFARCSPTFQGHPLILGEGMELLGIKGDFENILHCVTHFLVPVSTNLEGVLLFYPGTTLFIPLSSYWH